jgi:Tol biopolymer transport system component
MDFDTETRTFGNQVDTIFHAEKMNKSVSFPRISPDGRFLMITLSDHATFPIWHQEADLWMIDLQNGNKPIQLDALNSSSVESYHSWSSNGHWVVFSSRRKDGLYTRPYIAYIAADGTTGKPFILPQERGDFYQECMTSFNIPELVKGKVEVERYSLLQKILSDEKEQVKMNMD